MELNGVFHPQFEQVTRTFKKLLPKNGHGGAALCVYHRGDKVVDIWGGTRNRAGLPWEEDTIVFSASTTKGVTSTLLHILVDQGLAEYNDPVAKHWPAFGQNGKDKITIRQALTHQAGLYNIADYTIPDEHFWNWEYALKFIEEARPVHPPGMHSAYHAFTFGHLIGGLIEHIAQKPFQQVLHELLSAPLKLDGLFIGVPDEDLERLAHLITFDGRIGIGLERYKKIPVSIRELAHSITSLVGVDFRHFEKALIPDFVGKVNFNHREPMQAIFPAANGAFTARSLAKMYAALANGGEIDGTRILSQARVSEISKQQTWGRDKVINFPMRWRLGYHHAYALGQWAPNAFGHFGFGGSGAWCDPSKNLSMALTLNTGVGTPLGDLRIVRISADVLRSANKRSRYHPYQTPVPV